MRGNDNFSPELRQAAGELCAAWRNFCALLTDDQKASTGWDYLDWQCAKEPIDIARMIARSS